LATFSLDTTLPVSLREEASLILAKFQYRGKRYGPAEERLRPQLEAADPAVAGEARLHLARILRNTGRTEAMTWEYQRSWKVLRNRARRLGARARMESLARWWMRSSPTPSFERHPDSSRRRDASSGAGCSRSPGEREEALRDFKSARFPNSAGGQAAFWTARTLGSGAAIEPATSPESVGRFCR
jgi:hypothetical protein